MKFFQKVVFFGILSVLLSVSGEAKEVAVSCSEKKFRDCALKVFAASPALREDVKKHLGQDSDGDAADVSDKAVSDFINRAIKSGELDVANFGYGDGGDGGDMPAGHIGTMRFGMDSSLYAISMSLENREFIRTARTYSKIWHVKTHEVSGASLGKRK
jgi:hypothetical protein